jgi:hypothetical protein
MLALLLWRDAGVPAEDCGGAEKWLSRLQAIRAGARNCYKIMKCWGVHRHWALGLKLEIDCSHVDCSYLLANVLSSNGVESPG